MEKLHQKDARDHVGATNMGARGAAVGRLEAIKRERCGIGKVERFVPGYHHGLFSKADDNPALDAVGCPCYAYVLLYMNRRAIRPLAGVGALAQGRCEPWRTGGDMKPGAPHMYYRIISGSTRSILTGLSSFFFF